MEVDEKAIWIARRLLGFIALRELLLFYGLRETYFAVYDSVVLTGPTNEGIGARPDRPEHEEQGISRALVSLFSLKIGG